MAGRVESSLTHHFSTLAARYNELRTTDPEPVDFVARSLDSLSSVTAADVGCGTGRYMMELGRRLGKRLFVHFIDCSEGMLERLRLDPRLSGLAGSEVLQARAEKLPIPDESLDCVLTFHAIHHFDMGEFHREAARTLRPGGLLFIYTRLRDQNERSIWGQYFPGFAEKEKRLFDGEELTQASGCVESLAVHELTHFRFQRAATLQVLVARVRGMHYSTFRLYGPDELEPAIHEFEANVRRQFGARELIQWVDEYAMLTVKRI